MSERIRSMQLGVDKVLALEARVAELEAELELEKKAANHWFDEANKNHNTIIKELETENAKLKEGLDRLVRIYNERTDEVDKVREERNEAEYEAVELRAENARLRRYYEIAEEIRVTINNALAFRIDDLDAARTEVDK